MKNKNRSSGLYLVKFSNNILDIKLDTDDIEWDKYYVLGKTNDFDKTNKLITFYCKKKGFLDRRKNFNFKFIPYISFNEIVHFNEFVDLIKDEYNIQIYDDNLYDLNKKNNYKLQKFLIGDLDDLMMAKIITLYNTSMYHTAAVVQCNILCHYKIKNSYPNDPYGEFEKEGKKSRGNAESIIHFRRPVSHSTYVYVVGPPNAENGLHNFKVGIALDLNTRILHYQSHSPNKVVLYFFQSCYGDKAKSIETRIHGLLGRHIGMIHQDWCRMTLNDILTLIRKVMRNFNQPEYDIVQYTEDYNLYIPYSEGEGVNSVRGTHLCIRRIIANRKWKFFLSILDNGRLGTVSQRNKRMTDIKEFNDIKDCYNFLYNKLLKNVDLRKLAKK